MKVSPLKLKLKIKIFIDGQCYDGDEIITHLDNVQTELIRSIYNLQLATAKNKTEAVEWTADVLKKDVSTVWRAIKEIPPEFSIRK